MQSKMFKMRQQIKSQKKEDDPDYIDLMKRMRKNLEEKKTKNKTEKVMRK